MHFGWCMEWHQIILALNASSFLQLEWVASSCFQAIMSLIITSNGGFIIYAILGNLSKNSGKDVKDVVSSTFGLAFITYPEAIAKIKISMADAWYLSQMSDSI
ncbi:hypothetical protein PVAND_000018 [Polypedilum vanderplanki]|uniref:Uncharacterized protein n=1 Tax=Polypedilum vanderplanki TaxID=319348 RepID=A0A9J6BJI8_POLVA|nr:hypothetical protein PVAND_000018 [Polypedilum vanderplanki]